jgi:hypothetical protein
LKDPREKDVSQPAEAGEQPDATAPDNCWTLHTFVPEDRLDWLIGNLSHDDAIAALLSLDDQAKADAYQFVIQRKINSMIEPPNPADLEELGRRMTALGLPAPHVDLVAERVLQPQ